MSVYPPTPSGVERVRPATITNNHSPSPASEQGSIHHLVQSPDTDPCLLGQPSIQAANITDDPSPSRTSGHLPLNQPINQPTNQTTNSPNTPKPPGSQPLTLSLQHSPQPSVSRPSQPTLAPGLQPQALVINLQSPAPAIQPQTAPASRLVVGDWWLETGDWWLETGGWGLETKGSDLESN